MTKEKYDILTDLISSGRWEIDVESGIVAGRFGSNHSKDNHGYYQFTTSYGGKKYLFRVHQIVMAAAGINLTGLTVNHKNGNKTDNRIENLEAIPNRENLIHAWETGLLSKENRARGSKNGKAKLTEEETKHIKKLLKHGYTGSEISKRFGVCKSTISAIKHERAWQHIGAN